MQEATSTRIIHKIRYYKIQVLDVDDQCILTIVSWPSARGVLIVFLTSLLAIAFQYESYKRCRSLMLFPDAIMPRVS